MTTLDGDTFRGMVVAAADAVEAHAGELSGMDAVAGDGDHGVNLRSAMSGARSTVQDLADASPADVLHATGDACTEQMGGAAGALFGAFFAGAAAALGDRPQVDATTLAEALAAGVGRVQQIGGAGEGDRTMVDALAPAAASARAAARSGSGPAEVLAAAAAAARAGADGTRDLVPAVGRARYAADRAVGTPDPGATSVALILEAWAGRAQEGRGR